MNNELLSVLEYMEKEKGISRREMIESIIDAIKNAAKKGMNAGQELKIEINSKTGALKAWALLRVVDSAIDQAVEIHIEKAKKILPEAKLGDVIEKEIDPAELGRIAAQTARQVIMQRIRSFEKAKIYEEYKDLVGEIVSGVVRRRDKNGDLYIDLGKSEAVLPRKESIWSEDYSPGDRIRCYLLKIEATTHGPEIILSRTHTQFIRRLFELEVSEIADGTVTVNCIAREPGCRTKLCVSSKDPNVDPVGACVGTRGSRVKNIVKELGGEKFDIIRYHEDPEKLLEEAMKPAIPKNIQIDREEKRMYFEVSQADLPIAIGKQGQNAKLTSKLIGWKLEIGRERSEGFEERKSRAVEIIGEITNLSDEWTQKLINIGITTPEAFEGVNPKDLMDIGFDSETANTVLKNVQTYLENKSTKVRIES